MAYQNEPTLALPALRMECVACGVGTAYFPARGGSTEETRAADLCGPCKATIGLPDPPAPAQEISS